MRDSRIVRRVAHKAAQMAINVVEHGGTIRHMHWVEMNFLRRICATRRRRLPLLVFAWQPLRTGHQTRYVAISVLPALIMRGGGTIHQSAQEVDDGTGSIPAATDLAARSRRLLCKP